MAGVAGSDLAEFSGFGQVIGDRVSEATRLRPADSVDPGPRIKTIIVSFTWIR